MSWRKSQSAIALTIQIYMIWQTLIKRSFFELRTQWSTLYIVWFLED